MDLARLSTGIIVAAVVMVALVLMPFDALAHAVHPHQAPEASLSTAIFESSTVTWEGQALASSDVGERLSSARGSGAGHDSGSAANCNMGCCGSISGCCMGNAIGVESTKLFFTSIRELMPCIESFARPSTDPELLPRPPKTFV